MTKLLIFLAVQFYGALAAIFTVAFIEHRQVAKRQATEPAHDESLTEAA